MVGILSEIDDEEKAIAIVSKFLDTSNMIWLPKEETRTKENSWLVYKE